MWRYDPVILSNATPASWHLEQAERIAERLKGATRRLMFSFYDFYGKGEGRLSRTLAGTETKLEDITAPEQRGALDKVTQGFKTIADRHHLQIFSCCEAIDLTPFGIRHGACIDGSLISELFGVNVSSTRDKNQRENCNCIESADMGIYNSCRFRCSYCYANFNEGTIESNVRKHFPDSPSLLYKYEGEIEIRTTLQKKNKCRDGRQKNLF